MRFVIAFALACCLCPGALAVPTQVDATYEISTGGLVIARVSEHYVQDGDRYRIRSTTRAEGILKLFRDDTVVLTSEGSVGPGGLRPLHFEQRQQRDPNRDIVAGFDWEASLLRFQYRGERDTRPLPEDTQDRLSVMYQFMHMSAIGAQVRMPMSNGRKIDYYTYRKVDEPVVTTPAGEFAATHYQRVTEGENENDVQLWLGRERFNLVVRVEFEDSNGLRLVQTLVDLATRQP